MVERLLGENMVMGLAEEEEVRPVSFYWYAEEDDFDEEGNLNLYNFCGRKTTPQMGSYKKDLCYAIR